MNVNQFSNSSPSPIDQGEIKIKAFIAEPYPDGRRVKIKLLLSSFQRGPNAVINISDQDDLQLASINIVSIFSQENEITIHIPGNHKKPGIYTAAVDVFNIEEEEIEQEGEQRLDFKQSLIDSASTSFSIQ
ncbi:MAG: hypothetical protein WBB69_15475 [Anaerolineales bacterium]